MDTTAAARQHRQPTGAAAHRWKGGRYVSTRGYVFIRVEGRYVQEHRLVAEHILGRPLMRGEIVHHLNHDKVDNRPENLAVMRQGEHARQHLVLEQWARGFDCCQECRTTERAHAGKGLCKRCQDRQGKSSDTFQPWLTGRWARRHDRCVNCGTIERPHICRGLCSLCYERQRQRSWKRAELVA